MNLNKLKIKNSIVFGAIIFALFPNIKSDAVSVSPVYFGQDSAYIDSDVPPAIKLNQAYDGLAEGTYLYRTKYRDISYYTPVTPSKYRDTANEPAVNKNNYREWGPWSMATNQVWFSANAHVKYFNPVTVKGNYRIYGEDPNNPSTSVSLGTLGQNVVVMPKSRSEISSGKYVYFDLTGTPLSGATNSSNIARVSEAGISTNETPTPVFRSANNTARNFSYLGNYINTMDSSHENLEVGKWQNSNSAPDGLKGEFGEWHYLGYNSKGEPLKNPYFPSPDLAYRGNSALKYYDWRDNPYSTKSTFDGDNYYNDRYALCKKLLDDRVFDYTGTSSSQKDADIKNLMKKFTFLTHPTKDTAVLDGKRIAGDRWTRQFTVLNPPGDLYVSSIEVYDGGTKVASYSYNLSTGNASVSEGQNIKQGRSYTVKVKLGNARNGAILASKNQATIGITRESSIMPLSGVNKRLLENPRDNATPRNTIGASRGSVSEDISFTITAPTNAEVFDIYALVGESHDGTDNIDYTNDAGRVRMFTDKANTSTITVATTKANLKATKIELLNTSDTVVYSSDGSVTKNAIIPGNKYKIRYTMKNIGDRPSVTIKEGGYMDSTGKWHPGAETTTYPSAEIYVAYSNTLKVKDGDLATSDITLAASNKKVSVNGSTAIQIQANGTYSYTTEDIYFDNPYMYSTFTLSTSNNNMANSSTTDDTYDVTVSDLYDYVIRNVKIHPAVEYVFNGNRYVSYNVTYEAKLDAANHIKSSGNISERVKTKIVVGDKSPTFDDIIIAKDDYQKFSHTVKEVLISPTTSGVKATVELNYNRKAYETDYTNNSRQSGSSVVKIVNNPFNGSNSDVASSVDTSTAGSASKGGSANNNCLIPRRNNSWTVSHRKHTWTPSNPTYSYQWNSFTDEKYSTTGDSTVNKNYTESFKITNVLFKSKETEGKGSNGWIDLMNLATGEEALVKAGYGFELKIVSEYRTDMPKLQPSQATNTRYTGVIEDIDITYNNEIFVELPGTDTGNNQTRKILSTTGYSNTTEGLVVSKEDIKDNSNSNLKIGERYTYTIKPSNTLGISSVGKIFIPTGMKDGQYKISIYTAPITGIISDGKGAYTSLCDRRDINIEVNGAYTDDLNSNIVQ